MSEGSALCLINQVASKKKRSKKSKQKLSIFIKYFQMTHYALIYALMQYVLSRVVYEFYT